MLQRQVDSMSGRRHEPQTKAEVQETSFTPTSGHMTQQKKGQKNVIIDRNQAVFFTEKSTDAASCETKAEQQISQQTKKPLAVIVLSWEETVPGTQYLLISDKLQDL